MNHRRFVRAAAAALSLIYLATNCAFAYKSEVTLWDERRQFAQLPAPTGPTDFSPPFPSLPKIHASVPRRFENSVSGPIAVGLVPLFQSLSASYGSIRDVKVPAHSRTPRTIIHIQDVHGNTEAQQNIGQAIQQLINDNRINTVALEGAFGVIDLTTIRKYSNKSSRVVADYLLREKRISGPIYTAFTSEQPIPTFVGVDDAEHYVLNVNAYRESSRQRPKIKKQLEPLKNNVRNRTAEVFNAALLKFDSSVQAFREERLPLGAYAQLLAQQTPKPSPTLKLFVQALELENTINFSAVEAERSHLLSELLPKLSQTAREKLVAASVAYRTENLSHADFYGHLKNLCQANGIRLTRYPAMNSYLRYVIATDRINTEDLFRELKQTEKMIYSSLAKTTEEKDLVAWSARVSLTEKLLDFSLTREEWNDYKSEVHSLYPVAREDLLRFEQFYSEAEKRDERMTANLCRAMNEVQGKDRNENAAAILVTGGFHSSGIDQRLVAAGYTVISFVPTVTKSDSKNGSAYLSVFTQQKTPLDQLFAGEKLFLAEAPMTTNGLLLEKLFELQQQSNFREGRFVVPYDSKRELIGQFGPAGKSITSVTLSHAPWLARLSPQNLNRWITKRLRFVSWRANIQWKKRVFRRRVNEIVKKFPQFDLAFVPHLLPPLLDQILKRFPRKGPTFLDDLSGGTHGFGHFLDVVEISLRMLARSPNGEKAELKPVVLGAFLHDVGHLLDEARQEEVGVGLADKLMRNFSVTDISLEDREHVKGIIRSHRKTSGPPPVTSAEKLVADADRLSANPDRMMRVNRDFDRRFLTKTDFHKLVRLLLQNKNNWYRDSNTVMHLLKSLVINTNPAKYQTTVGKMMARDLFYVYLGQIRKIFESSFPDPKTLETSWFSVIRFLRVWGKEGGWLPAEIKNTLLNQPNRRSASALTKVASRANEASSNKSTLQSWSGTAGGWGLYGWLMPSIEESLRWYAIASGEIWGGAIYVGIHAFLHFYVDVYAARGEPLNFRSAVGYLSSRNFWVRVLFSAAFSIPYLLLFSADHAFVFAVCAHVVNNAFVHPFIRSVGISWPLMSVIDPAEFDGYEPPTIILEIYADMLTKYYEAEHIGPATSNRATTILRRVRFASELAQTAKFEYAAVEELHRLFYLARYAEDASGKTIDAPERRKIKAAILKALASLPDHLHDAIRLIDRTATSFSEEATFTAAALVGAKMSNIPESERILTELFDRAKRKKLHVDVPLDLLQEMIKISQLGDIIEQRSLQLSPSARPDAMASLTRERVHQQRWESAVESMNQAMGSTSDMFFTSILELAKHLEYLPLVLKFVERVPDTDDHLREQKIKSLVLLGHLYKKRDDERTAQRLWRNAFILSQRNAQTSTNAFRPEVLWISLFFPIMRHHAIRFGGLERSTVLKTGSNILLTIDPAFPGWAELAGAIFHERVRAGEFKSAIAFLNALEKQLIDRLPIVVDRGLSKRDESRLIEIQGAIDERSDTLYRKTLFGAGRTAVASHHDDWARILLELAREHIPDDAGVEAEEIALAYARRGNFREAKEYALLSATLFRDSVEYRDFEDLGHRRPVSSRALLAISNMELRRVQVEDPEAIVRIKDNIFTAASIGLDAQDLRNLLKMIDENPIFSEDELVLLAQTINENIQGQQLRHYVSDESSLTEFLEFLRSAFPFIGLHQFVEEKLTPVATIFFGDAASNSTTIAARIKKWFLGTAVLLARWFTRGGRPNSISFYRDLLNGMVPAQAAPRAMKSMRIEAAVLAGIPGIAFAALPPVYAQTTALLFTILLVIFANLHAKALRKLLARRNQTRGPTASVAIPNEFILFVHFAFGFSPYFLAYFTYVVTASPLSTLLFLAAVVWHYAFDIREIYGSPSEMKALFAKDVRYMSVLGRPTAGKGTLIAKFRNEINTNLPPGIYYEAIGWGEVRRALKERILAEREGREADSAIVGRWGNVAIPQTIKQFIAADLPFPQEELVRMLNSILDQEPFKSAHGIIFDNFPHGVASQETLTNGLLFHRGHAVKMDLYLLMHISKDIARERARLRRRADDTMEILNKRLIKFFSSCLPVIQSIQNNFNHINLNATVSAADVYADFSNKLRLKLKWPEFPYRPWERTKRVRVQPDLSFDVERVDNIFTEGNRFLLERMKPESRKAFVIAQGEHWRNIAERYLRSVYANAEIPQIMVLPKEIPADQTEAWVRRVFEAADEANINRKDIFVLVGNEKFMKLTSRAAAEFHRGIATIQIPTTKAAAMRKPERTGDGDRWFLSSPEAVLIDKTILQSVDAITVGRSERQPDSSYDVTMTRGIFDKHNDLLNKRLRNGKDGRRFIVAIDSFVGKEVIAQARQKFEQILKARGQPASDLVILEVAGGESIKNERAADFVNEVHRQARQANLTKRDVVVAIGGGAVIDAVGFAASTFDGGIPLFRIPTTLLSAVDGGVGTKNAVNFNGKKNFQGVFAPPEVVYVDPLLLKKLPRRIYLSGIAEMIKVSLIKDAHYFALLENHLDDLVNRRFNDTSHAEELMWRSIVLHLEQIETDPYETKLARPLDLGHEHGHRLEFLTNFALLHGEGVTIGVAIDAVISWLRNLLSNEELLRILKMIERAELPIFHELATVENLVPGLNDFAKHLGGEPTFSLIGGIGNKKDVHAIWPKELDHALDYLRARIARPLGAERSNTPPTTPPQTVIEALLYDRPLNLGVGEKYVSVSDTLSAQSAKTNSATIIVVDETTTPFLTRSVMKALTQDSETNNHKLILIVKPGTRLPKAVPLNAPNLAVRHVDVFSNSGGRPVIEWKMISKLLGDDLKSKASVDLYLPNLPINCEHRPETDWDHLNLFFVGKEDMAPMLSFHEFMRRLASSA